MTHFSEHIHVVKQRMTVEAQNEKSETLYEYDGIFIIQTTDKWILQIICTMRPVSIKCK
jgi:hypothetical protein